MSRINVLVATTVTDVKAEVIAACVEARPDMRLVTNRCLSVPELDAVFESIEASTHCALVLVGRTEETSVLAQQWLMERPDLVVLVVDIVDDIVQIELRDPRLESLLTTLRDLVERVGLQSRERVAHVQFPTIREQSDTDVIALDRRPLLRASIEWVHNLLRDAVACISDENGDVHGFGITRATLLQSLDARMARVSDGEADTALTLALQAAQSSDDPLAIASNVFQLTPLELRLLVLGLAPELDLRFQRCIGFLLDDMSRRVGTMGLYCSLLGEPARIRSELASKGTFSRWPVFEAYEGHHAAADEPLRLDPFLSQWLLGARRAFENDPRVRRVSRLVAWPGSELLQRQEEREKAIELVSKLQSPCRPPWLVLGGDDPTAWRALLELGARARQANPIRIEPAHVTSLDAIEIEESARRIARMARLTGDALFIDQIDRESTETVDDGIRLFVNVLDRMGCTAAVISCEEAHVVRLLGDLSYEFVDERPLSMSARVAAMRAAATGAGTHVTAELAEAMINRYPLNIDSLESAMRLASSRRQHLDAEESVVARFTAACKELAAEGISKLADRIEPVFSLTNVVLPSDRKAQLAEIVDHVRLAPRVLDEWKFRDQLPYGRGVTALFFGPSGTGKTMAALGIARQLGIQMLRLDLSRVVSKYIGDTEKNIDRVFTDAQRSGSAILIDEADALFGKRSEVKDAHDRYANIEVSYLLQRMEAYEGLAILTTNMRQNLDSAFLRRLRFIVDFPRPDVAAREKIWRQCLPDESHELDDAAFHQLARRIDLTGGHIRQITLRAAFIAAAACAQINLEHIAQAARAEFAKLGMPPPQLDVTQSRRAA